jgi:hypothetical protein
MPAASDAAAHAEGALDALFATTAQMGRRGRASSRLAPCLAEPTRDALALLADHARRRIEPRVARGMSRAAGIEPLARRRRA